MAVLASGVTSIAGFGVLAFSRIAMLRDFGLVTVVDLTVALARGDARAAGRAGLVGGGLPPAAGAAPVVADVAGRAPAGRRAGLSDGRRRSQAFRRPRLVA